MVSVSCSGCVTFSLSNYSRYNKDIRRIMYTTNIIKGFHGTGHPAAASYSDKVEGRIPA